MIRAWRLVKARHAADAFSGEGARRFGGRWNSDGVSVVYCSASLALAALEILVHLDSSSTLDAYVAIPVEFDDALVEDVDEANLPESWRGFPAQDELKRLGNRWVRSAESAILRVPSAIVPDESNYLLNPAHQEFREVVRGTPRPFSFDSRLLPPRASTSANIAAPSPALLTRTTRFGLPDDALLGFVEIPPGEFLMGSDKAKDILASEYESPQHRVPLPGYFIGRYEVTVAQFKACSADGGCRPEDADCLEGADDEPVRQVSWHEALAYCAWLETKLKSWPNTPGPLAEVLAGRPGATWHVTLPSEAEWEKAARGTDGRIYPWGDTLDPTRANYWGAGPEKPTRVGSYPAGVSPYGLLDMSGNVWEWTRSHFRGYPYLPSDGREDLSAGDTPRVMRGGSFGNLEGDVRAAGRGFRSPDDRNNYLGFRVVVSPFSSGTKEVKS